MRTAVIQTATAVAGVLLLGAGIGDAYDHFLAALIFAACGLAPPEIIAGDSKDVTIPAGGMDGDPGKPATELFA